MLSCSQRQNLFMFAIQPYLPRECVGVKAASGGMFAGSTSTSCGISSGSSGIFGPQALQGYPEDPAEFKPLTEDELQRIKKERRQKEAQRKQKAAENRKHLANVRVVQKNLVFVVGLSQRLADPEVLKKHEYFGKFGKIHKVVINQSTSYAGAQGPSASAYVTYHRPEDALKAIQAVNNIHVDGRTLKASLGTTKYCSHFLRGSQCPKLDCMYLHELGEEAASFTKEEMQQGKHQEYEQKLYEMFMNSQNVMPSTSTPPPLTTTSTAAPTTANSTAPAPQNNSKSRKKTSSPSLLSSSPTGHTPPPQQTNPVGTKEAWPSLPPQPSGSSGSSDTSSPVSIAPGSNKPDRLITNGNPLHSSDHNAQNRAPGFHRNHTIENNSNPDSSGSSGSSSPSGQYMNGRGLPPLSSPQHAASASNHVSYNGTASAPPPPGFMNSAAMAAAAAAAVGRKLPFQSATDSMSLFSSTNGFPAIRNPKPPMQTLHPLQTADDTLPVTPGIPDSNIPVSTSTDWQAAFGFTSTANTQPDTTHDDDLGFDPWNESAKALAEIIERENDHQTNNMKSNLPHSSLGHHTHSPQGTSPRQQQQQQQQHNHHHHSHHPHEMQGSLRQPPGMPQLISSMAQITQLLENRPAAKTLPPGINPNHLGAAPNNQMGVPGSKIMGLMHFPSSVPQQNLANQSAYSDMMNSDSSHTAKREPFPHPQMLHKEDPTCNKDWQEGLRALLPNINIRFGGSQNAVDGQRLQNTQPQLHTGQQQAPHKNWSSSHGTSLDRSWDPAIVTSGHIPDGHSEEPHWMASLHQLTDDSTSLSNPSTARTQAPHRAPLGPSPHLYNTPAANNGSSWPPHTLGGAPHPPPGFHTPSTAPQIRPHSQVNTEVQQLADGYQ